MHFEERKVKDQRKTYTLDLNVPSHVLLKWLNILTLVPHHTGEVQDILAVFSDMICTWFRSDILASSFHKNDISSEWEVYFILTRSLDNLPYQIISVAILFKSSTNFSE